MTQSPKAQCDGLYSEITSVKMKQMKQISGITLEYCPIENKISTIEVKIKDIQINAVLIAFLFPVINFLIMLLY